MLELMGLPRVGYTMSGFDWKSLVGTVAPLYNSAIKGYNNCLQEVNEAFMLSGVWEWLRI